MTGSLNGFVNSTQLQSWFTITSPTSRKSAIAGAAVPALAAAAGAAAELAGVAAALAERIVAVVTAIAVAPWSSVTVRVTV
jgi:hypothetical protein